MEIDEFGTFPELALHLGELPAVDNFAMEALLLFDLHRRKYAAIGIQADQGSVPRR